MFGQKALELISLLSYEYLSDDQNYLMATRPNPPAFSGNLAWSLDTLLSQPNPTQHQPKLTQVEVRHNYQT